jgi:hypothetical protein
VLEQTVGRERRSGIAEAAGRGPARGNGQHDDAKPDHRHSHEFKHQSVHGNFSRLKTPDLSGSH